MADDALRHLTLSLQCNPQEIRLYPIDRFSTEKTLQELFLELCDGYIDNTNSSPDIIYPQKKIFLEEFSFNKQQAFLDDGRLTTALIPDKNLRRRMPLIHKSSIYATVHESDIRELSEQFAKTLKQHNLKTYKEKFPGYKSVLLVSDFTPSYLYPPSRDQLQHVFMPDMYFHKLVQKAGWNYLFWYYDDIPGAVVAPEYRDSLHMYERSFFGLNPI
jgi:hypothetical protein